MRLPSLRRAALAFTATALATVAAGALAAPADAAPVGPCTSLRAFTFNTITGGDDLRDNSEVTPFLTSTAGDIELQHFWGPYGNGSSHAVTVTFQNPNWSISSCSVTGIKLHMVSHNGIFQTDDNWNMDFVSMSGYGVNGEYRYYVSASVPGGGTVKRFTGSDQWWSKIG
ncbi:MAG TPA: hypothetical protein VMU51_30085 [Mycobacteriales bacterium]|nr:hypothetical protein [Mycobacteriales bacterium]